MNGSAGALDLSIRAATLADAPAIGAISVAAQRAAYPGVMTPEYLAGLSDADDCARWADLISRGAHVVVAQVASEVAGFARWSEGAEEDLRPARAELRDLFVDPRAWRRAVGSELLRAVVAEMRDASSRIATLWVVNGNRGARAFYEARGWNADGVEERHDRFRSGAIVHVVRYRRAL